MTLWLDVARLAAGANAALLLVLGGIWLTSYRRHGASHTLALLVVAAFLLVENALWLGLYLLHPEFIGWFRAASTDVQIGITMLCGLELVALAVLTSITWR